MVTRPAREQPQILSDGRTHLERETDLGSQDQPTQESAEAKWARGKNEDAAACRELLRQEKLPLGHPYMECRRLHGRVNEHNCAPYNHCDECGEFESAHQPTQEKP